MSNGGSFEIKDGNRVLKSCTKPQKLLSHEEKIKAANAGSVADQSAKTPIKSKDK